MDWINYDIAKLPRLGAFPLRVKMLYFSHHHTVDVKHGVTPDDMLELSIRLEPHDAVCCDVINGNPIRESFPNLVWKKPGGSHRFFIDRPRDAISFGYPAERIEDLRRLGLYPGLDSISFRMTPEIERLTHEYRKLCLQLYTPGVADQIDWVCFLLNREILYANLLKPETRDDAEKIRNLSVYLQVHFAEPVDWDELARTNGFSRASFFRKWKQIFQITPAQYILKLKLEAAARFLAETDMPVSAIVREVHFSGTTAFHRRFRSEFGMTPAEYRRAPAKP